MFRSLKVDFVEVTFLFLLLLVSSPSFVLLPWPQLEKHSSVSPFRSVGVLPSVPGRHVRPLSLKNVVLSLNFPPYVNKPNTISVHKFSYYSSPCDVTTTVVLNSFVSLFCVSQVLSTSNSHKMSIMITVLPTLVVTLFISS